MVAMTADASSRAERVDTHSRWATRWTNSW
jgi:hypothetical protein